MKRVLVDQLAPVGALLEPDSEECHHLIRVRRIKPGEMLEILDGHGGLALGEVTTVNRNQVVLRVTETLEARRESPLQLTVAAAIPSQLNTFDSVLPGLVQMGVTRFYLVPTAFGGRMKKSPERYVPRLETIIRQSLKQCGRTTAPSLTLLKDWPTLCTRLAEENEANVVFHPVEDKTEVATGCTRLSLLIGPEGGFSDEEVALAKEQGFVIRGLGPRILKMETALIACTSWAQSQYGDLS